MKHGNDCCKAFHDDITVKRWTNEDMDGAQEDGFEAGRATVLDKMRERLHKVVTGGEVINYHGRITIADCAICFHLDTCQGGDRCDGECPTEEI